MHISYQPLWDTLKERGMRKEDLRLSAGLTTNMIANMGKGKHISMAAFSLKIAPKHDTKNRYPPISTVTAEMGGFSMIGGTMPRMSKKRKLELSFFLNDRGRVAYNDLCRKCQHECKQSFRAVVIDCPHYLSKRAKRKEKTD